MRLIFKKILLVWLVLSKLCLNLEADKVLHTLRLKTLNIKTSSLNPNSEDLNVAILTFKEQNQNIFKQCLVKDYKILKKQMLSLRFLHVSVNNVLNAEIKKLEQICAKFEKITNYSMEPFMQYIYGYIHLLNVNLKLILDKNKLSHSEVRYFVFYMGKSIFSSMLVMLIKRLHSQKPLKDLNEKRCMAIAFFWDILMEEGISFLLLDENINNFINNVKNRAEIQNMAQKYFGNHYEGEGKRNLLLLRDTQLLPLKIEREELLIDRDRYVAKMLNTYQFFKTTPGDELLKKYNMFNYDEFLSVCLSAQDYLASHRWDEVQVKIFLHHAFDLCLNLLLVDEKIKEDMLMASKVLQQTLRLHPIKNYINLFNNLNKKIQQLLNLQTMMEEVAVQIKLMINPMFNPMVNKMELFVNKDGEKIDRFLYVQIVNLLRSLIEQEFFKLTKDKTQLKNEDFKYIKERLKNETLKILNLYQKHLVELGLSKENIEKYMQVMDKFVEVKILQQVSFKYLRIKGQSVGQVIAQMLNLPQQWTDFFAQVNAKLKTYLSTKNPQEIPQNLDDFVDALDINATNAIKTLLREALLLRYVEDLRDFYNIWHLNTLDLHLILA